MDIANSFLSNQKPLHLLKTHLSRQYTKLYPKDLFIGVVGSLGKTTTVEAIEAVLSKRFKTLKTEGNISPVFAIPKTLLKLTPQIKKVVIEMGVEHSGEMDFYLSLVQPKVAVFTKTAPKQTETIDTLKEEIRLVSQLPSDGVAILNWDDSQSKTIAENSKGEVIYYGTNPKTCTVWAGNIKIEDFRTTFELNLGVERVKVNLQLLGSHQIYPSLAAAAIGVLNNIPLTKIKVALESVSPEEHKLQALFGPNGSIILDDTLRCSTIDLEFAIDTMLKIPARRRILVLGEMKGLGEASDALHRQVARLIFKEKIDHIYLGMGDANIIADELKNLGYWEERLNYNLQNSQLVGKLLKNLGRGDICLIKGSRSVRLDEVVKRITKNI